MFWGGRIDARPIARWVTTVNGIPYVVDMNRVPQLRTTRGKPTYLGFLFSNRNEIKFAFQGNTKLMNH